jgi:Cu+-exporting ATPase
MNLDLVQAHDFLAIPGHGVRGLIDGHAMLLGSPRFVSEHGIDVNHLHDQIDSLRQQGHTVLIMAREGQPIGLLSVADSLRPTSRAAIRQLQAEGMRVVMLTGDNRMTADAVARQLGITEVHADVLPADKLVVIRRLQTEGRVVAMAGDGINDAPALAQADVGIALGAGADVAMASAAITLVRSDLRVLARARALSRATVRTIRENLFLAFVYNVVSVPLAAVGMLSPMWAAAAMSLSSLSVVGNSLRLRRSAT